MRGVAPPRRDDREGHRPPNPRLQIDGILPTMYDGRTLHSREVVGRWSGTSGDQVFHTVISRTVKFPTRPWPPNRSRPSAPRHPPGGRCVSATRARTHRAWWGALSPVDADPLGAGGCRPRRVITRRAPTRAFGVHLDVFEGALRPAPRPDRQALARYHRDRPSPRSPTSSSPTSAARRGRGGRIVPGERVPARRGDIARPRPRGCRRR